MSGEPGLAVEAGADAARDAAGPMPPGLPLRAVPLFYFIHIQKTAGTTMRMVLKRMFGAEHSTFFTVNDVARDKGQNGAATVFDDAFFGRHLLIGGHFPFSHPVTRGPRTGRKRVFLTLWRDPVRRVVSQYDYVRQHTKHALYGELSTMSLAQAVEQSRRFRKISINHQLLYTFGNTWASTAERTLEENNFIIGTTERLDEFVDVVSAFSGMRRPPVIPRANQSGSSPQPILELAREQSDYELALDRIRDANRAESDFITRHLSGVLVTTSRTPFVR